MKSYAVIGLGFGDEGKGATVDWLCRETGIDTIVRFSGGCQAGHNVVTPEGLHHTFSQFGSGTFTGARTVHTGGMMVEPYSLMREAAALEAKGVKDPLSLVDFDLECLVTTPYHWIMNRLREDARSPGEKHGSCGRGIGETRKMQVEHRLYLQIKDLHLYTAKLLATKLNLIRDLCLKEFPDAEVPDVQEVCENYKDFISRVNVVKCDRFDLLSQGVILEGSQGILLDEKWGFAPHNTWSDLTLQRWGARWDNLITTIGVTRSYLTRHGAGPFPTEAKVPFDLPEPHNVTGKYQGHWRTGYLDVGLLDYALSKLPFGTKLAITHVDVEPKHIYRSGVRFGGSDKYEFRPTQYVGKFSLEKMVDLVGPVPIALVSTGPTHKDRIKIGEW